MVKLLVKKTRRKRCRLLKTSEPVLSVLYTLGNKTIHVEIMTFYYGGVKYILNLIFSYFHRNLLFQKRGDEFR